MTDESVAVAGAAVGGDVVVVVVGSTSAAALVPSPSLVAAKAPPVTAAARITAAANQRQYDGRGVAGGGVGCAVGVSIEFVSMLRPCDSYYTLFVADPKNWMKKSWAVSENTNPVMSVDYSEVYGPVERNHDWLAYRVLPLD